MKPRRKPITPDDVGAAMRWYQSAAPPREAEHPAPPPTAPTPPKHPDERKRPCKP